MVDITKCFEDLIANHAKHRRMIWDNLGLTKPFIHDYDYDDLYTQFGALTRFGVTKTFGEFVSNYKLNQQKIHCDVINALKEDSGWIN